MTTELQSLIAEREAIETELVELNARWDACNDKIIALCAKHKRGDIASFERGRKNYKLSIGRVYVAKNMITGKLYIHYAGQLVRKDGTVGTMGSSFSEELVVA